jgi:hypothetical protein
MAKKKSKVVIIEELLSEALKSEWSIVDTSNNFIFDTYQYKIDDGVKQYQVLNKPKMTKGQWNDWTNESLMTNILCIDNGDEIRFFDQNFTEINSDLVVMKLQ